MTVTRKRIAGDASDRQFFRIEGHPDGPAICMQFPKWEGGYGGDPISWLDMHQALVHMGLPLPRVLHVDPLLCEIWTEDLGDVFLNGVFKSKSIDMYEEDSEEVLNFYRQALSLLLKAQYPESDVIPHPAQKRFFDVEKLFFEMNFFIEHFLIGFLKVDSFPKEALEQELKELCQRLSLCEPVLCHRDYHVRNIMLKDNQLYWIDFQDARMGPHTYDVVSLVRDSYVSMTWETRKHLFDFYFEELNKKRAELGLLPASRFFYDIELILMGTQRNLKALGSFGYLVNTKKKMDFLKSMKPTIQMLNHPQAQNHGEFSLSKEYPNLGRLLKDMHKGPLAERLCQRLAEMGGP